MHQVGKKDYQEVFGQLDSYSFENQLNWCELGNAGGGGEDDNDSNLYFNMLNQEPRVHLQQHHAWAYVNLKYSSGTVVHLNIKIQVMNQEV